MWTSKFTLYCLSLLLSSFFTPSLSAEKCHPNDKRALLEFKQSFGNPYLLTSWSNDTDCCRDWYSVKCDRTFHRIISLSLFQGGLSGEIPAIISNLPYLDLVMIRIFPNITGSIPEAITKLKNLKILMLDWNNLSGPVPSFFNRLKNLNSLILSFNNFTGSIPPSLSLLPNLSGLSLDRNKLTGSIPESFGSFKQGDFNLDLSHNQLSGPIPSSLVRLNFTSINLSRNQLTGDASLLLENYNGWVNLDLSRNQLEFNMNNVEFGPGLATMILDHNKIYGSIPASLANLPQLYYLNVSYNRLCGSIPTGGTLSEFDEYSYFHNRCLCGSPLPPCH